MRSFQSGITLPRGQPLLQKGTPQSMQRAAWTRTFSSGKLPCTSCQSRRRSATGRMGVGSRRYSTNPVGLPISTSCLDPVRQRPPIVPRKDLHELLREARPFSQNLVRAFAAGVLEVPPQRAQDGLLVLFGDLLEIHHARIAATRKVSVLVQHVSDAAAHPGGKVAAGRTQDHYTPAGHI